MKKKTTIIGASVAALILVAAWCIYALAYPGKSLANEGLCRQSTRVKAIDATRLWLGGKTSAQLNYELNQQCKEGIKPRPTPLYYAQ